MKRRDFMRQAGGATAAIGAGATATAGTAAAQEGGGGQRPDFGGYTDGAKGGEYLDARGESEVTVEVGGGGGLAYLPTDLWIDTGTTVTFEWASGGHNVLFEEQPSDAGVSGHEPLEDEGFSFSVTFDTGGIYKYFCQPHKALGMLGAIAVGGDVPTVSTGGGGGGPKELHDLGVAIQAHWVGAATILGIIMSVIFTFYLVKYGESAHTGTGR
ncbi:plastocyanin/azurin family copper-binding protein [Halobaculum rubrum]|uniref:plastocyanin/azurin family copper-binding protein n=1 Tax=Halobaculum rubrum TaxID=2872158 RepID=UPI001CA41E8C|nr:plastocyanin/azurin family copper-binding protein [Halobaculum rubrum]QZY00074.1 halocyanin [Halobaculum rubrum]